MRETEHRIGYLREKIRARNRDLEELKREVNELKTEFNQVSKRDRLAFYGLEIGQPLLPTPAYLDWMRGQMSASNYRTITKNMRISIRDLENMTVLWDENRNYFSIMILYGETLTLRHGLGGIPPSMIQEMAEVYKNQHEQQ